MGFFYSTNIKTKGGIEMHKIKGLCVNVVDEKTTDSEGKEQRGFKILQVVRNGLKFVHEITGTVYGITEVTNQGVNMQGITLMRNGGKYVRMNKILDEDLSKKYTIGKEIKVHALPDVRNNKGKPEVFYTVVDPEDIEKGEPFLASIRDWNNGDWPTGKELELKVNVKPYIGQRFNGIQYTIQNDEV
jgi:hypothetical protein